MCCFSKDVEFVRNTRIFCRHLGAGKQGVVYAMHMKADQELAMILPIPVAAGTKDNAVTFLNLKGYANFFDDLAKGFPPETGSDEPFASGIPRSQGAPKLKVENVGAFEASFVPTTKDFSRLDERFRLPEGTWEKLGAYADFGFVVFQLRKGEQDVHPMAFSFPTRHADKLFFPTVHVHDGEVHEKADFDHTLYCQIERKGLFSMLSWNESLKPAIVFTMAGKAQGLLNPAAHVFRHTIKGIEKNEDILLAAS